jgi:DNA-binding NarL/FixJ family response regulator
MEQITILITDDHTLVREAWSLILNSNPKFKVIAKCNCGEEAVELAKRLNPDVVTMDINLPNMNGIEATKQIRKFSPATKVLGVSQHSQPVYARKMMRAGALGYITKNSDPEEMFEAISEIFNGRKYVCNEIKNILSDMLMNENEPKKGINSLSGREIEIMEWVTKGSSSKDIAAELNISPKTVEVHRYNILRKLNLKNTSALVNYIHNNSLGLTIN